MTTPHAPATLRFGRCRLEPGTRSLWIDNQAATLGARAFDVLWALVENRHRVVGKDELLREAWPGRVVEENNLQVQVSNLRRLLGPGHVATVAGQGYRFVAPVEGDATAAPRPTLPAGPPAQSWPTLELHADERLLRIAGRQVRLQPRMLALLQALIAQAPRPVAKQALMAQVWPGTAVSEGRFYSQMVALRRLLGPSAIVTVPGRGYAIHLGPARPVPAPASAKLNPGDTLIGREQELLDLSEALQTQTLVTLCGPAGMGKTRLAQALVQAQQAMASPAWRDGVWWVDLVPLSASGDLAQQLPRHLAQALGLSLPAHTEPAHSLASLLAPMQLLLVLDNCEHLGAALPRLLLALREAAAGLHVLATSREPLQLAGETVLRLGTLALPRAPTLDAARQAAAVQLFVRCASRVSRQFVLDDLNVAATTQICTQLDGLPLAIELAAGRVPLLGVQGVHDKLGQALRLLGGGAADADPRHRSLVAALDWSYALLPPAEQALYRQLSVFAGGFTPQLLAAMLPEQDEWQLLDQLGALVDKSLVVTESSIGHPAPGTPRCRMLQTLQAHAASLLDAHGEALEAQRRHARTLCTMFDTALDQRDRATLGDYQFADQLLPELANAMAALDTAQRLGDADTTFVMADGVAALLFAQGRAHEGLSRLLPLLPWAEQAGSTAARARLWHRVGRCGCNGRLPHEQALAWLARAAQVFEQLGWHRRLHECQWMWAEALFDTGRTDEGELELAKARTLEAPHWHPVYGFRRQRMEGFLLYHRGRLDEAAALAAQVAEQAAAAGQPRYELTMRCDLGAYQMRAGQTARALATHADVVQATRGRTADRFLHSESLRGMAECAALLGQRRQALQCLHALMPLWRMSGLLLPQGGDVALVLARLGEDQAAGQWLGAADACLARSGKHRRGARPSEALRLLNAHHAPGEVRVWCAEGAAMRLDALERLVPQADAAKPATAQPARQARRNRTG